MAFGLADHEQEPALTQHVVERLRGNAAHAAQAKPHDDFAELYFLKFALDALVRIERYDVAERVIADHMQVMREHDAWTFWECLHRGTRGNGSLCHSWSTAPLEYLHPHRPGRAGSGAGPTRYAADRSAVGDVAAGPRRVPPPPAGR